MDCRLREGSVEVRFVPDHGAIDMTLTPIGTEGLSIVHTSGHDGQCTGEGLARWKALIAGEGTTKGNLDHDRKNDHVRSLGAS